MLLVYPVKDESINLAIETIGLAKDDKLTNTLSEFLMTGNNDGIKVINLIKEFQAFV